MKLCVTPNIFFPDSAVTTAFGWDPFTFPGHPRIHHAIDRAGKGIVRSPLAATRTAWINDDAQGCSVLRLFFPGGELRLLHFLRDELDSGALASALSGAGLEVGAPLGPTGNHGLSVSASGGDGRHVHYSIVLEPGAYDDDLSARLGDAWATNRMQDYHAEYGRLFLSEVEKRGIVWMNRYVIARHDPYYSGRLRFYVNPAVYGL